MTDENITLHQKSLAAALTVLGVEELAGKIYNAVFAAHTAGREEGYTEGYQTGYGTATGELEVENHNTVMALVEDHEADAAQAYSDGWDDGIAWFKEQNEVEIIDAEFDEIGDEFTAYDSHLS